MYKIRAKENIDMVDERFWELNPANYSCLYRTKTWLKDSQGRLGDLPVYVEVFNGEIPVALFPVVIFKNRSDYPPVDPHRIAEKALQKKIEAPVAMCTSFFGLGCPVLTEKDKNRNWKELLQELHRFLYNRYQCVHIVFAYLSAVDDPWLGEPVADTFIKVPHKDFGLLSLHPFADYECYLQSLPRKVRASFRREQEVVSGNGVRTAVRPIQELDLDKAGVLAANVFRKYGNEVDPRRLTAFARYIADQFPKSSGCFTSWLGDRLLSYSLFIQHNGVLYMKMLGRDYDHDRFQTYFQVVYHLPIQYAFKNHIQFLDYGAGAPDTKKRRGIEMIPSYACVI